MKFDHIILPVLSSIWSALFGTQSVVQAKVLAELLALKASREVREAECAANITALVARGR